MRTIDWQEGAVVTIDQTRLPNEEVRIRMNSCTEVARAIKEMKIRGAPLLGAAAAFALALTTYHSRAKEREELLAELNESARVIRATRPTAVNLFWALDRILARAEAISGDVGNIVANVISEAKKIADEDAAENHVIGRYGAKLLEDGDVVLTHCNAGALATVEYGTALGVVRAALEQGKRVRVVAAETRPLLQGARLTAYELRRDAIPVTLIVDGAVGFVMYKRLVNKVIVGADRITRDAVINKVGTFTVAVLAKEHGVPFYVAAPRSTFDFAHASSDVVIEERAPEEVTQVGSEHVAPEGVGVLNPAFDVTPFDYVSAIICEDGIFYKKDFDKLGTG
jgi:methylthioribose-1-phosphate isomerase